MANKFDLLGALLKTNCYDFILISETWLKTWHKTSSIVDTTTYHMYRNDRDGKRGGGVAIIVKKNLVTNINIIKLDKDQDFEILALDYFINNRTVHLSALLVCISHTQLTQKLYIN